MFMTADLLDWATSWQPPALIVEPPPQLISDSDDKDGSDGEGPHPPLMLRRRSTAAPLPLEGILKLHKEAVVTDAVTCSNIEVQQHPSHYSTSNVKFMSSPDLRPAPPLFDGPPCFIGTANTIHHTSATSISHNHHNHYSTMRTVLAHLGTSPARADDLSSQSQSITAPSSPSVNTTLRSGHSFVNLTRKSSEVMVSQLSRSNSLSSSSSMKTRALASAAAAVVRHIVEVGACGDLQCLMFYDPDVFINPLSLSSRLRIASFRKHPGGTSNGLGLAPTSSGNGFGAFVSEEAPSPSRLHNDHNDDPLLELESEAFEPVELDFDLIRVSRRLFSSVAQQSAPLQDYLLEALNTLSNSNSPLLSTPETFVIALVLLERMQHASLLARAAGSGHSKPWEDAQEQHEGLLRGSLFAGGAHQTSPTSAAQQQQPQPTESSASADDRVRSFLDGTTQVRLTKESLQSLGTNGVMGSRQCSTPSAALNGIVSDTESNALLGSRSHHNPANSNAYATMCVECIEQPGLALHASNVHLFFAAAISVAIKMREDFANGPLVLQHVAELMHCPNVRTLCLAERCLCDMLKFDVTVSTNEYRLMLRQLASHRPSVGASSPTGAPHLGLRDGQGTPVHGGAATPVHNDGADTLASPQAGAGNTSPGASSNFMTLFASV